MEPKQLRKILTSISLAGLIATAGVTLSGCATTGDDKAKQDMSHSEKGMTSCSGGTSCS